MTGLSWNALTAGDPHAANYDRSPCDGCGVLPRRGTDGVWTMIHLPRCPEMAEQLLMDRESELEYERDLAVDMASEEVRDA